MAELNKLTYVNAQDCIHQEKSPVDKQIESSSEAGLCMYKKKQFY